MDTKLIKDDQNKRYLATIIIFVVLVSVTIFLFWKFKGEVPKTIAPWDFIILTLACFRLIRLFTYDTIMRVVRDWFLNKEEIEENGQVFIVRTKPMLGGKRSLSDLFGCPWCIGMWISFFMILFYFLFPPSRYFILILALAGAGSGLQIIMNKITKI